jgi:aspartyl-tRNA(Asn)/glutamyl-tRNA(Gln) amidotransferase subunit C
MAANYTPSTDKIDVRYVAHLARLHLSEAEADQLQGQLEQILGHVKELSQLNVEGVEPTAHAMPMNNVFREDEVKPCMDREKALANAPKERHGQFVVPKIVE